MSLVQSVLLACEAEIAQAAEISAMRALQSEQDAAYLRSLEIDKEKLKLRKRESQITEVTDNSDSTVNTDNSEDNDNNHITKVSNIYESEQRLNERIIKARKDLENEPEDGNVFKFQFLFPDGTRKIRKFSSNSIVKVRKEMVCNIYLLDIIFIDTLIITQSLFDYVFAAEVPLKSEKIAIRSIEPAVEFIENEKIEFMKLNGIEGIGKGIKLFIEYTQ